MEIKFPDVFGVGVNARGVSYLYNMYDKEEVIAKVCTVCSNWHFLNDFNKSKKGFAGTHSLCRDCHKESNASFRMERKENEKFEKALKEISLIIKEDIAESMERERQARAVRARSAHRFDW